MERNFSFPLAFHNTWLYNVWWWERLWVQLELLWSVGFVPMKVDTHAQSAFRSLTIQFESVVIDVGGLQDYVPTIDAKIKRIKEVYRGIKSMLQWRVPGFLVQVLVAFAVYFIDMHRTSTINCNVALRVMFMGLKPDFVKELGLGFGDYCKVYDGMDNKSRSRTILCIALYTCGNSMGSWNFFNLVSK